MWGIVKHIVPMIILMNSVIMRFVDSCANEGESNVYQTHVAYFTHVCDSTDYF